ncbi:MAG: hypothetical protein U0452_13115 [Anaerolineae bacterium]
MKPWKMLLAGGVLAAVLGPAALVGAQKASLDPTADPNYGSWPLAEFPDPFIMTVQAGGDVDASSANVGEGCVGQVTSNPDIVFDFNGGPLRAFFASDGDTTLIVHQPDGTYVCNDDSAGVNPMVDIPNGAAGTYALWIGTFSSGSFQSGYVVVTSGSSAPGALSSALLGSASASSSTTPSTTTTTTTGGQLDPNGNPTFGTLTLASGFQPDPTPLPMVAGGSVDIFSANLGDQCRGYVASPPDARVAYTAPGRFLRIFFQSDSDTTMVVRLPDGSFVCNDDFTGALDPLVDINAPAAGTYDIWIGTFAPSSTAAGTLYFSSGNTADPTNTQ